MKTAEVDAGVNAERAAREDDLETVALIDEVVSQMPSHLRERDGCRAFVREILLHADKKSSRRMIKMLRNSTSEGQGLEQMPSGAQFIGFRKMFSKSVLEH